MNVQTVLLKEYSSLKTGGEGKLVTVGTEEELKEAVMHAKAEGLRVHILGGGTNTYFGEDLSEFLFLQPAFRGVSFEESEDGSVLVRIAASEIWDDIVSECVSRELWGVENLSYIPGTAGAAPVQNIGAYGVELAEVFVELSAFDMNTMERVEIGREACRFGYRDSLFKYEKGRYVITEMTLSLSRKPTPVLYYKPLDAIENTEALTPGEVRDLVIQTRKAKLPDWLDHPNAGSFFKNPILDLETTQHLQTLYREMPCIQVVEGYKIPAAWLIEHVANMKGARVGNVGTWPNQPLVIVNYGQGTAEDVDHLARVIVGSIHEKTGIVLTQEANRIG